MFPSSPILRFLAWGIRATLALTVAWMILQLQYDLVLRIGMLTIISFLPFIISTWLDDGIPPWMDVFLSLCLFAGVFGSIAGWYTQFLWYDDLLHFVLPAAFSLVVWQFAEKKLTGQLPPWALALAVVSISVHAEVLWELYEYVGEYYIIHQDIIGTLEDTLVDIAYGIAGSAVATIGAIWWTERRKKGGILQVWGKFFS